MKLISLTQGQFAQVDDADYNNLIVHKWCAFKCKHTYYAGRRIGGKSGKFILMHREIMDTLDDQECDHIDFEGLNNQRFNLRNCTHAQNNMNRRPISKSGYKGVYYKQSKVAPDKFYIYAQIWFKGLKYTLGQHKTEEDAARAYDKKAKEFFGEYAYLNFPDEK